MSQSIAEPTSNPSAHAFEALDDWRFATPAEVEKSLKDQFPEEQKAQVWSEAAEVVKTHYEELTSRWKEESDTLLVYAGLFSAVLTAFNVQSYQLLQPAPADTTVLALQQISTQLNSFMIASPFVNSTHNVRANVTIEPSFQAPSSAVWINTLWFSSLVCSLGSASLTLIVKQWLQQAITGLSGTSRESARLRQYRLNGLIRWRVGAIVVALPILLHLALILFLVGMIVLLWTLHAIVATVTTLLVAILFAFLVVVTVLPVFSWDCCYRSPQAFAVYQVIRLAHNTVTHMLSRLFRAIWRLDGKIRGGWDDSLVLWLTMPLERRLVDMPTWHGREQTTITRYTGTLDRSMATTAYSTTLSPAYLDRLHVVLSDLPWGQLNPALQDIWATCEQHWGGAKGPGRYHWFNNVSKAELSVIYAARQMLVVPEGARDDEWINNTISILGRVVSTVIPDRYGTELIVTTLAPLAIGNNALAWRASDHLATYWTLTEIPSQDVISYFDVRSVLSVADWRLRHWSHEEYTFDNFRGWCRAAQCVLLCISRSHDNGSISATQLRSICDKARVALLQFEDLLWQQNWSSLGEEKHSFKELWRDQWINVCPHRLSAVFVGRLLRPLRHVYEKGHARHAIPESFVTTLEGTWYTIERSFPSPMDFQLVKNLMIGTEWNSIGPALNTLKVLAAKLRHEQHIESQAWIVPYFFPLQRRVVPAYDRDYYGCAVCMGTVEM